MDTSSSDHRTPTSSRRPISAGLAALALVMLALVAVGAVTAIEQHAHPPTCFGIGFGCTPDPFTTALLVGMIFGAPTVAVAWLVTAVGWVLTRQHPDRVNRRATWWPVWLLAVGLAVVAVLAFTAG
jgi:hypothetical protein